MFRARSLRPIVATVLLVIMASTVLVPAPKPAHAQGGMGGEIVYLINVGTGRFLDADPDGSVNQSTVPSDDDRWLLRATRAGYVFTNLAYGGDLSAGDNDTTNPFNTVVSNYHDVNLSPVDNTWTLGRQADGTYDIRNMAIDASLDADWGNRGYNVDLTVNTHEPDSLWHIVRPATDASDLDGARVFLVNEQTGRFLDADPDGTVEQSVYPGDDDVWEISKVGPAYSFTNTVYDRYLDADGHRNGYDVNLSDNLELDTQWDLRWLGGDRWQIDNLEYRRSLDADKARENWGVDLTTNPSEPDGQWRILIIDPGPDTQAPTSPGGLAASGLTQTSFHLDWTAATDEVGVIGYDIYVNAMPVATVGPDELSYAVSGLDPDTEYRILVIARDAMGHESVPAELTVRTLAPLAAPLALIVDTGTVGDTAGEVAWESNPDNVGVFGYFIYLDGMPVDSVDNTVMSYAFVGLTPDTTHMVEVTAVDDHGRESPPALVDLTTLPALGAPTGLAVVAGSLTAGSAEIQWDPVADAAGGYEVFIDGSSVGLTLNTNMIIDGLGPSTTYTAEVVAIDSTRRSAPAQVTFTTLDPLAVLPLIDATTTDSSALSDLLWASTHASFALPTEFTDYGITAEVTSMSPSPEKGFAFASQFGASGGQVGWLGLTRTAGLVGDTFVQLAVSGDFAELLAAPGAFTYSECNIVVVGEPCVVTEGILLPSSWMTGEEIDLRFVATATGVDGIWYSAFVTYPGETSTYIGSVRYADPATVLNSLATWIQRTGSTVADTGCATEVAASMDVTNIQVSDGAMVSTPDSATWTTSLMELCGGLQLTEPIVDGVRLTIGTP